MRILTIKQLLHRSLALIACTGIMLALSPAYVFASHGAIKGSQGASGHPKADFVIPMNYELGMHCTGFEFAYCCVLPAYNSILAQVIKTEGSGMKQPLMLEGDPNVGRELDVLGRETVLRDPELDADGNFKKYVLRYWHDAQPRNDGNGAPQSTTLISNVEGNSLLAWNTIADAAWPDEDGKLRLSGRDGNPLYNGSRDVVLGNCAFGEPDCYDDKGHFPAPDTPIDNYQNAVWNHLYIYSDTEGSGGNTGGDAPEANKLRLGLDVAYPTNVGPAGHIMGPNNVTPLENVLTFSEDTGTVVFTQMKVLEDLPITLTSPRIWEALGLTLTPFEDTINFFGDPGAIDEDSVRPYVEMKAQMFDYHSGDAVLDSKGDPVIAFGTAPIDIPNCERCHSELSGYNSAQRPIGADLGPRNEDVAALVQQEMAFWLAYYPTMASGSDWYARLKGAAISILSIHDREHGTGFMDNYPGVECVNPANCEGGPLTAPVGAGDLLSAGDPRAAIPQNTRLGHESVICQKCHADNVIAVVKSATCGPGQISCSDGTLIPPLTEAIHYNHRSESEGGDIAFNDSLGRDGGCQGCHPAHRSDGDMAGYPITEDGSNFYANSDNRLANGGCFVGRDVHSNPLKDIDGAETPEHLNAMGAWLSANVFDHQAGLANSDADTRGVWCTNCHGQLGQEFWKAENMQNAILNIPGPGAINVRGGRVDPETDDVDLALNAVLANIGVDEDLGRSWLDPKGNAAGTDPGDILSADGVDRTHDIWAPDPGLCDYVAGAFGAKPVSWEHDGNVATVEVNVSDPGACSTGTALGGASPVYIDCGAAYPGAPSFYLCGTYDTDGDFNVSLASVAAGIADQVSPFCTTADCVQAITDSGNLPGGSVPAPVPFSAATDGRDHWLSAGEPHCADCHAAPYVEQSGNIDAFAPFNYPRKSSLMRYSRGHQDITCQGCHESIHGLYPVTPLIDTTSYAQAAQWNSDDSHGPLKCGSCHTTNAIGVNGAANIAYTDPNTGHTIPDVRHDFDAAVSWAHTYTDDADPRESICLRCHEEKGDNWSLISADSKQWAQHAQNQRVSRKAMDKAEIATLGHVLGTTDGSDGICVACHKDNTQKSGDSIEECSTRWKKHLVEGRVSEEVWEHVSMTFAGSTCGW